MSEIKIGLRQIELTDVSAVKNIFDSPFRQVAVFPSAPTTAAIDGWVKSTHKNPTDCFYAITLHKGASDVYIVGVCGLHQIDFISRTADLFFTMIDKDKYKASIQDYKSTQSALDQILKIGFNEWGLNKISIEILEQNKSLAALEKAGFVVEGVRREAAFIGGRFHSAIVLSTMLAEYRARAQ